MAYDQPLVQKNTNSNHMFLWGLLVSLVHGSLHEVLLEVPDLNDI